MTAPDIAAVPQIIRDEKMDKRTELDVEDSYYLLHVLESEAFSCVVTAMRAQGMLTEYKQTLLEHLKAALFVSDATYKAEMRRAANDEVLCKIAETLNPSYDSFVQWGLAADEVIPPGFNQIPLYADQDIEGLDVAGQLLRLANSHNSAVDNYNDALHELITLPKAPFVPEKLRVLLRETESDSNERLKLDLDDNVESLEKRSKKCVGVADKRVKKTRPTLKPVKQEKAEVFASTNDVMKSEYGSQSSNLFDGEGSKLVFENKDEHQSPFLEDVQDVKQIADCPSFPNQKIECHEHVISAPSVMSSNLEPNGFVQNLAEEVPQRSQPRKSGTFKSEDKSYPKYVEDGKWKRKKSKQKENAKDTCARVRPFLFDSSSPGQAKPPRGNPDKRATKRSSPAFSCQSSVNGISCAAGLSPKSYSTPTFSRGAVYTTLSPNISRFPSQSGYHSSGVVIKRIRTSSSGDLGGSHNGYYGRNAESNSSIKNPQLQEKSFSRILLPPSQSAAAWSNPARPYYGNPSAAAMGVTVRPSAVPNGINNSCTSNAGTSMEKISSQQTTSANDSSQMGNKHFSGSPVFLSLNHQPSKAVARRLSYCSKSNSVGGCVPIRKSPVSNGGVQTNGAYKNPPSPGNRQMVLVDRSGNAVDVVSKDEISNNMNSDDCGSNQEMRLECDEVMVPEHRCVISPRSSDVLSPLPVQIKHVLHPNDVTPRVSQQLSVLLRYDNGEANDMHVNRVVQPQFINDLLHQEDKEIVGLITSEQCIR